MRILHILDHSIPLHSGYTFRTRAILEQQRALGWETAQLTSAKHSAPSDPVEEVDGLQFYRTPTPNGILASLPIVSQIDIVRGLQDRLEEVVRDVQPDILHAHSPALNGLAALRVGARHHIPVVYECRAFWEDAAVDHGTSRAWGLRYRVTRALETRVFKQAAAVTTICEGLRRDIIDRGVPEERVTVIPNAVDLDKFSTTRSTDTDLAGSLGLEGDRVLGFIGSFYAYEGLPLLLKAVPLIQRAVPAVKVLLVGGGPDEDIIRHTVTELGIEDHVVFTGRVAFDEVQRYYDLVDIFVYPRYSMRLTDLVTPLKPLEAMAQGRLVVASDVGGHRELIQDGVNGRLFQAGDVSALAKATIQLLEHEGSWPDLVKGGRQYVEEERNWPTSVSRYQDVYRYVMEGPEK